MDNNTKDSIKKLRKLREALCGKEIQWKNAFAIKDAIVKELKSLKNLAEDPNVEKGVIVDKIDSLLIFVDPERQKDLENTDVN